MIRYKTGKLNLFKIFITGIPNITIIIEEREIDNNDQKNNIATTKPKLLEYQ
jgi:hypothetical protein